MRGAKAMIVGLVTTALIPVSPLLAGGPARLAGQLSGLVTDSSGRPQAGAVVLLYNKQDKVLQRVGTDIAGNFSFDDLLPDLYAIRVNFASFVPAIKEFVSVKPGMRSLLEVNLSRVFSSIQLVGNSPTPSSLMNEDWKWTLRADSALRPILRMLPELNSQRVRAAASAERSSVFSDSRGLVRISASDGGESVGAGEADLGTQFAFATSLYGDTHLKFSGNVGYGSASGSPAAAIRTTFQRDIGNTSPAVSLTMRQIYLPFHGGTNDNNLPALRSVAVSLADKTQLSDSLSVEYGAEIDMVSFLDRLHYFSPYARLNYALPRGFLDLTYTSGNARPELGLNPSDQNADLQREVTALSLIPRITLDSGRARVQRGDDYEAGITERFGSREYRISVYNESVSNNTLTIANPGANLFPGDLLPDLFSSSALFNAGRFETTGYTASVTQDLGDNYKLTATYGTVGVMAMKTGAPVVSTADDLRQFMQADQRPAVTLRASGTVRETGTRFVASYQWADYSSALPGPQFLTQSTRPAPGLNFLVRQQIPSIPGVPWRIEASAEMRNLLAQGYLPVNMAGGRQLLLVNTPRCVRGGLAFVF
ncbi:MAG: carboxypeptidase-like regulatory domain-containing protein [Acidobacteriota bacterium]